jgi:hypothetical protein
MKRSGPLKRTVGLQTRKPMPRKAPGKRRTAAPEENQPTIAPKARKPLKSRSTPKMTPARKSANGEDCTLCLPGCRNDTETVVLCHLRMFGGGGMGKKPPDSEAVYGCGHCHSLLDGRTRLIPELERCMTWETVARALIRTHRIMRAKGILMMKGESDA